MAVTPVGRIAVRRIAVLTPDAASDAEKSAELAGFAAGLAECGWRDGDTVAIEYRYGGGDAARIPALARELVAMQPDVVLCRTTSVAIALRRETETIPIVFVNVSDPVGAGLAASLERPGGNVTGLINIAPWLGDRWLELLRAINPLLARIAVLFDPTTTADGSAVYQRLLVGAAEPVATQALPVRDRAEIERAVAALAGTPDSALLVQPDITTTGNRGLVIALAAQYRLPAVYAYRFCAVEGGLAALGIDVGTMFRRAAIYVDRILRGADPGALAIEGPDSVTVTLNLETAAALDLPFSPALLGQADEIIGRAATP